MSGILRNLFVVIILFIVSLAGFGMDEDQLKAGHLRPSVKDPNKCKRQKIDHLILADPVGDSYLDPEEAQKSRFLVRQKKVEYFHNFRSAMEKKFCYAGSAVGEILDKLSALYLDRPSDKPGVFVIGSTPGVGKNTLVKHIRDFLENDPFVESGTTKGRFQLIKDKNKRIFDHEILKNTGSTKRLKKGIHKVAVIDEIQAMVKDTGNYNSSNELWFHAFGDAEINIDIAGTLNVKKSNIVNAIKKHFSLKTQLHSLNLEITKQEEKLEEARRQEPNNSLVISSSLQTLERKREEVQALINSVVTDLTVELRQLMSEIPDFFDDDERLKSSQMLAIYFLNLEVAAIERRFSDMPSYKHLYFDRNIYIFLGNPAKTNDEILEEIDRSPTKTRDSLRDLAKKKLTEATVRSWFMSHALYGQYYALNKRGWDSRLPHVFAICPPASKHLSSLISASIETDFCSELRIGIHIDDGALDYFLSQLKDPTKDLRSLSCCYSPILTKMFTNLERQLSAENKSNFQLERHENELVLMLENDRKLKATHAIKTKTPKEVEHSKIPDLDPQDDRERKRQAIYSAYFYSFYYSLFAQLPAEIYLLGDVKFEEMREECTREFNLATELSMLALNLVLKYVGMAHFAGELDRVFKKDHAIAHIFNIVNYISELKATHSNAEIYFIIKEALNTLKNSNFRNFFASCGIFEFINTMLIDTHCNMAVDSDEQPEGGGENTRLSNQEIANQLYQILINYDSSGQGINQTIENLTHNKSLQLFSRGIFEEFLKSKKLIVSFDSLGSPNNIAAAKN